jgi:hypothetical protein
MKTKKSMLLPLPIERKTLEVPSDVLREKGFKKLHEGENLRIPLGQSVEAMVRHPLNFLDDMRSYVTRFAEFEDEMVAFEREGEIFDLFATTIVNRFLFVGRTDRRVYQHSDWSPNGAGPTFELINTSLQAFVRCHCMEQSISFQMRAAMAGSVSAVDFNFHSAEAELRHFIEVVDKPALDSVYWETVLYELSDGLYQCVPTLLELHHKGRWGMEDNDDTAEG